jgi:hypothetical protein
MGTAPSRRRPSREKKFKTPKEKKRDGGGHFSFFLYEEAASQIKLKTTARHRKTKKIEIATPRLGRHLLNTKMNPILYTLAIVGAGVYTVGIGTCWAAIILGGVNYLLG